jgi:hypothetical protein
MSDLTRNPDTPFHLLMNPYDPNRPAEWGTIPEEILVRLAPQGAMVMSPEARVALNRLAMSEWFVVRNFDGAHCDACRPGGYGSRSRILGEVHDYVTIECIPSPFNGLRQIMWWMEDVERRNEYQRGTMFQRLQEHTLYRPPDDTFIPITVADAKRLIVKIKERGGRPVIEQQPLRPQDVDADLIRRGIAQRAERRRALTAAALEAA